MRTNASNTRHTNEPALNEPKGAAQKPRRPRRSSGPLPPPPAGVEVMTRIEAAAFMGVSFGTFGVWERDGRVTIPKYRAVSGARRTMFYAAADLARLREEFKKLEEPHPDPNRPGVYRVPVRTHKGVLFALIDAEDLPKVQGKNWNVRFDRKSAGENGVPAKAEVILSSVTQRVVPLKRIIMGVDAPECKDQLVCMVNGDPFDCRRANLVIKTWSDVVLNRPKMAVRAGRATLTKYKGVRWDDVRRLWLAQIGGRETHRALGRFRDEAQAAAAYDAAAREIFGDAALLNFPDGIVPPPTFLGPDGQPVREKNKYRVPRGLPTPPPGVDVLTCEEAAEVLGVGESTFRHWILDEGLDIPRYRAKATTGAPILYAAADIARLREELDKVGQPYPDPHPARTGVWRVPLRTLGGYIEALIDERDLPVVQGRTWNLSMSSGKQYDKGAVVLVGARDLERVLLKRVILGLGPDDRAIRITHANGNPLDCRRENLVVRKAETITRACFKILHRSGRPTTSRFKGVCWVERAGMWQAQIRIDDKPKKIGFFDDEEDAAHAYDQAAREQWGLEARVNFPGPGELPSAAAPVDPAELMVRAAEGDARMPGKPTDLRAVRHADGSVTLSWRSANAAASAGVRFDVSRRLPGQATFRRIGIVRGATAPTLGPSFTDTTVPAADIAHDGPGVEYLVQPCRGPWLGEASAPFIVRFDAAGILVAPAPLQQAA